MSNSKNRYVMLIGIAILLSGCGSRQVNMSLPERRPLSAELEVYEIPARTEAQAAPTITANAGGQLALKDALALALLHNPDLSAWLWEVRAGEARRLQAGLWPNPEVEVEIEEFGGSGESKGFDSARTTVALNQLVEMGGKRTARKKAAHLETRLAGWDYETKRLDVITETTIRFIDVLAAQKQANVARSSSELTQRVYQTVAQRIQAGKDSPVEELKARGEKASANLAHRKAQRELETARRALVAMWGGETATFESVMGRLDDIAKKLPLLNRLYELMALNPDLARWPEELKLTETAIDAEKAGRIPDLSVGTGIEHSEAEDGHTFVASVGLELPLFNRNQGGVREAKASYERKKQEADSAEIELRKSLAEDYQTLLTAVETVRTIEEEILPAAEKAFTTAEEGYRMGKFNFMDVLDAQRTLFEVESELIDAQSEYHKAVTQIERSIGQSLNNINEEEVR